MVVSSSYVVQHRYVHGSSVDERLVHWAYDQNTGAEISEQYYHRDHQGSIVAMSGTSGARAAGELYTYDAYGNMAAGNTDGQPFRYTGRRWDDETGLYYYRARYYSAKLGRFLQTDPIGYEDNMNMYGYVGNDPVNKTDPTGRVACGGACVGVAVGIAARHVAKRAAKPIIVASAKFVAKKMMQAIHRKIASQMAQGFNQNIADQSGDADDSDQETGAQSSPDSDAPNEQDEQEEAGREKGKRFTSKDDPEQQFQEIEAAQRKVRQGKSRQIIDNTEKSKQRADNALKDLKKGKLNPEDFEDDF